MHKDVKQLLKSLRKQGFVIAQQGSNHYRVTNPDTGDFTTIPSTPSDPRGLGNAKSELRKMGWQDPSKPTKKKGDR